MKISAQQYRNTVYRGGIVYLYPGRTADYGNATAPNNKSINTNGSTTAGLQEALDYAGQNQCDLHIVGGNEAGGIGGWGGAAVVYNIHSPVLVPPMQGRCISSGAATLNFNGDVGASPGMIFDSMMMGHIDFRATQLVYQGSGPYSLIFRPQLPVPIDGFACIVDSHFFFHVVTGNIWFDNSFAGIAASDFSFNEINSSSLYGILVTSTAIFQFRDCWIKCPHIHN